MLYRLVAFLAFTLVLAFPSAAIDGAPAPTPDGASVPNQSNAYSETVAECYARCAVDFDRCIAAGYDPDRCYDRRWGCEQGDCPRAYTPTPEPQPEPSYKEQPSPN